jgi:hypothetical protein
MTAEQRKKLKFHKLGALKEHARKDRALYVCQYAANASKHWEVTDYPDPEVKVEVWHDGTGWTIHFIDEGKYKSADIVFEAAFDFWNRFIRDHSIGKTQEEL